LTGQSGCVCSGGSGRLQVRCPPPGGEPPDPSRSAVGLHGDSRLAAPTRASSGVPPGRAIPLLGGRCVSLTGQGPPQFTYVVPAGDSCHRENPSQCASRHISGHHAPLGLPGRPHWRRHP